MAEEDYAEHWCSLMGQDAQDEAKKTEESEKRAPDPETSWSGAELGRERWNPGKKAAGSAGGGEVWWCRRRGKKGGRNNRISLAPTSPRLPVRRCCLHTGTSTALWHPATCTLAPGPTAAFPHQPLPGGAGEKKICEKP